MFDIAQKMFVLGSQALILETKIMVDLVYAKSLLLTEQFVVCLEFIQNEYAQFPSYSVFLYKYGKYVLLSKQQRYYGSGMGILDEAFR